MKKGDVQVISRLAYLKGGFSLKVHQKQHLGVSKNRGIFPPKWMVENNGSKHPIKHGMIWVVFTPTPIFGETPIYLQKGC